MAKAKVRVRQVRKNIWVCCWVSNGTNLKENRSHWDSGCTQSKLVFKERRKGR